MLTGCGDARREAAPAAVVLVSLDTVRADHLGAWGYPRGTTPHLDRFARRGALFAGCVAQAASTLPSHRSMFRSRPASLAAEGGPMLAEVLQAAGIPTVAFTGGGNVAGELGFDAGFDIYEESDGGLAWSVARLEEWLARGEKTFFAFLHCYDAHVPYDPPVPYDTLFDAAYDGPVTGKRTRAICRAVRGLDADMPAPELDDDDRRHLVALYDGGLRAMDSRFGRLIRVLERREAGRRATVIVMSDHGEEFWDHGTLLHSHTVYHELVRVPLLLGSPAGMPGRVVPGTVRNLEVAPTVLDAFGLPAPESYQGVSLRGLVEGAGRSLPATSEMKDWKALTVDPWKLIVTGSGRFSLFDLRPDPGETGNVARQHGPRAQTMARELAASVRSVPVRELSGEGVSDDLRRRLQALGYVE